MHYYLGSYLHWHSVHIAEYLYFGMLVPLTISSASGLYLPVIFAIATGIPVIIIAWVLAYTVSGIGGVYNKIKIFELWFRRVIAVVFIIVGIYYIYQDLSVKKFAKLFRSMTKC